MYIYYIYKYIEKKEEILPSPITKASISSKHVKRQYEEATKNFHYTTIDDLLRTVCLSNYCHLTGVVKYKKRLLLRCIHHFIVPHPFHLPLEVSTQKDAHFIIC